MVGCVNADLDFESVEESDSLSSNMSTISPAYAHFYPPPPPPLLIATCEISSIRSLGLGTPPLLARSEKPPSSPSLATPQRTTKGAKPVLMAAFRNGGRAHLSLPVQPNIINSVLACELTNSPYPLREGRSWDALGLIAQRGRSAA